MSSLSRHPRPVDWIVFDGRSPGSQIFVDHLPSREIRSGMALRPKNGQCSHSWVIDNPLTVAGAATVLVPLGSSAPCSLLIPSEASSGNRRIPLMMHSPDRQGVRGVTTMRCHSTMGLIERPLSSNKSYPGSVRPVCRTAAMASTGQVKRQTSADAGFNPFMSMLWSRRKPVPIETMTDEWCGVCS